MYIDPEAASSDARMAEAELAQQLSVVARAQAQHDEPADILARAPSLGSGVAEQTVVAARARAASTAASLREARAGLDVGKARIRREQGFLGPIGSLVSTAMQLETLQGYMARVEDVLDAKTERRADAGPPGGELSGQVELERLSFRYTADGPLVVNDVSLKITAGECVAIVGASGSGKSTLARLLAGLYTPTSGAIAFDGIPLSRWDPPLLRRRLGMVTQDTRLFAAPIRENIALLDGSVPLPDIEAAAKLAHIHDDIVLLPMGYDTVLSDGGSSLSGGQRQRLALARAVLHRPAMLVLDEATSALDTLTEQRIAAELSALRCTRILIAHRLSTVVSADRIVVLERGRVVAVGTHAQLLSSCALYAALVAAQTAAHG